MRLTLATTAAILVAAAGSAHAAFTSASTRYAVVNFDGTLDRGHGATSSGQIGTGEYQVIFNRDVTSCAYIATIGNLGAGTPPNLFVGVAARAGNTHGVFVAITTASGAQADGPFHLSVLCPR